MEDIFILMYDIVYHYTSRKTFENYIPSSNLLFCGYEVTVVLVMYDETYGTIYEVIMRKSRASLEPF